MRIARVLTRLNLGGPARQALASDPILAERGHRVRVFAGTPEPGEGDLFETFVQRGIEVVRIPGLRRGLSVARDLFAARRLRRELCAYAPEVLHTHASKAGALGRRAARALPDADEVARVHTFHGHVLEGYFPAAVSRKLVAHERRLAAQTDRIVAVSHATADDLVRLGVASEEKLVVIQPGVELDRLLEIERPRKRAGSLRGLIGAGPSDVVIGVLGRLAAVKRPEVALDVWRILAARHPELHLVYIGDGDQRRDLERRVRALGESGSKRVHLVGAVTDVAGALRDLDGVLLTSRSEGLPVALIEAAAAGLPVVATEVGGVGEVVAHERTGFLGTNAEELAFGLSPLVSNGEERRAMGERARLRIGRLHSAERLAARLEELYEVVRAERLAAAGRRASGGGRGTEASS